MCCEGVYIRSCKVVKDLRWFFLTKRGAKLELHWRKECRKEFILPVVYTNTNPPQSRSPESLMTVDNWVQTSAIWKLCEECVAARQ